MNRPCTFATLILLHVSLVGCVYSTASQVEHELVAFDIAPDGRSVVFSSADADLFLLDLDTKAVRRVTNTAAIETSPAFAPDGKGIIYASQEPDDIGSKIYSMVLESGRAEELTSEPSVSDATPRFSRDGFRIAFARAHRSRPYSMGGWTWDNWDAYVMDANGKNVTRLTHDNRYQISDVVFSTDGKEVLFSADNNRGADDVSTNLFQVPVDASAAPIRVPPQPTRPGKFAAWTADFDLSPDRKALVVISDRVVPYEYDLVHVDRDNGHAVPLGVALISRYNQNPRFAPDGKMIFFLAGTEWNASSRPIFSLWSVEVDGKNAKQVADSTLFTDPMKWNPNE